MANPIIKIKRGTTAPLTTLQAGEFAIDQAAKNLYLGVEVGGIVTNEIVGGNGTFATHTDVATAVTSATGALGTMSTQNANAVNITGGTIDGTTIGATTPSTGAFTTLTASSAPSAWTDVVRKTDLDSAVSALGSVFHFVGDVSSATTPLDLSTLSDTATGAYYKVDVAGAYTDGATTFNAKVGDAFVKTTTGWQKLDNVDAVVSGTSSEIAVTGDENVGYTVALDSAFKTRVSDVELKTVNITATAPVSGMGPASGTTDIVGGFSAGAGGTGGSIIKIPANAGVLEFNEFGNQIGAKVHATLDLVDSSWGLGNSTDGYIALRAAGHLVGVDHTYGGSSQMSKIENFIIDGGTY